MSCSTKIGYVKLSLIQGNQKTFSFNFANVLPDGTKEPLDLSEYEGVRMDVKSKVDIDIEPLFTFTLGSGLTISGDDNEILSFTLEDEFNDTKITKWFFDILFDGKLTLLGGEINITNVVTV
jgi:hypothetical protein